MIFLSHTHADKPLIEPFALKLREIFGEDSVFYDSWSIQPGDGIVKKMSEGLHETSVMFFFVSKNSLDSQMVEVEWQNALLKATRGSLRLVPVKLDDCVMPAILTQTLYINLYGQGADVALRQIVDVASGESVFLPSSEFQNVRAIVSRDEDGAYTTEFSAEAFLEPKSSFMFLVSNSEDEVSATAVGAGISRGDFKAGIEMDDGRVFNGVVQDGFSVLAPGFPFVVKLEPVGDAEIEIGGILREVAQGRWEPLPFAFGSQPEP